MPEAFINQEEQRLSDVCGSVDRYNGERRGKLAEHDRKIKGYEVERLESVDPREKDRLTKEIHRLSQYDPAKYLVPFEQLRTPYLAGLLINDDDPRIGRKHLLFGKQGLMDGSRVVVVDWRKAEISRLFYDWEEGEDYEEDIGDRERTGVIEKKIAYGIQQRELLTIQTGAGTLVKRDGLWTEQGPQNASAIRKEATGDHRMVDIVSLISKDQFGLITQQHDGCLYLTGGAGCGKTTVALHRLSYLLFNQPELFRPQRCLVVMFNRSLCDYVRQTSKDLLTEQLAVETFHSWAAKALRSSGVAVKFSAHQGQGLGPLKKQAGMYHALVEYAATTKAPDNPIADLGTFYSQTDNLSKHLSGRRQLEQLATAGEQILSGQRGELSFDDSGILLHLIQLRCGKEDAFREALGWYDHILIDEAQDLSLAELKALTFATNKRRSMTVCADEKQKILDFVDGEGFSAFRMDLKGQGLSSGELSVSYRSTAQIMALASRVSGRPVAQVVNEGPDPRFHRWETEAESLAHLARSLRVLLAREPKSLTAVICRYKSEAQQVYGALKGLSGVRLQTAALTFEPGILVTNVHQVKGLEFGGVILWNPTKGAYPVTELGKNLLYVAITRASNRLAIYHHDPLTDLLETAPKG
ncbi:helicase [Syntrophotalea acetylenivorans]|uniref:DNA 3'-5' helicase II n=1 Tax=Syntrophotalea acetylenivorans TaxID=1842532 RepID=A0A1L3GMA5_9BACT|nr:UvrD-helicase domain-containing protein [Syntrophotalea acetylenivorans]APG27064.1 helicase [Syntrophotalea acetylenivorans]